MDLNRALDGLMRSGIGGSLAAGLAGGLAANAISGKKTRKLAGSALKVGGAVAIGGLAWKAYQRYRSAPDQAAVGGPGADPWAALTETGFQPTETMACRQRDLLVIRAMIAAAHADSHLDEAERRRIFERIDTLGLDAAEKGLLFDELRRPLAVAELAAHAASPELAAEVYAAALLAIDESQPISRAYLAELAEALALPTALVVELHRSAGQSIQAVSEAMAGGNHRAA
jgi:uncharacterized membrane protein YebE (DUF533 family)